MTDLDIPFPTQPMQVSPPGTGFSSQLGTLLFGALIAGCALLIGPFFLLIGWVAIMYVSATLRARRAVVRALSNQVLRPVLLRLDRRDKYSWTVSGLTPAGAAKSCDWEAKGMPIFMDLSRNL